MNIDDTKNVELIKIELYYEKEATGKPSYYLNLIYTYSDIDGKHELQIPKVNMNIFRDYLPTFTYSSYAGNKYELDPIIKFGDHNFSLEAAVDKFSREYICKDRLIEPRVEELTVEEIEAKLGYKVKIVNKK